VVGVITLRCDFANCHKEGQEADLADGRYSLIGSFAMFAAIHSRRPALAGFFVCHRSQLWPPNATYLQTRARIDRRWGAVSWTIK
jgi:hypothetical protein